MVSFNQIVDSIPSRFRKEHAQNYTGVFQFNISGNGFPFTISITNGKCSVTKGLEGTPKCIVTTNAETYVKLELGESNPTMAVMTGKVKVSNVAAMMEFSKLFYKYRADKVPTTEAATIRPAQQGPLKGLKVLDFTRLLPGPLATMLMADMGAEIIKIEDPDSPDYIRDFPPTIDGTAAYYLATNRGKKSLAIRYRKEAGKAIIQKLVQQADILIEQFRPGVMAQFGLGFEDLKTINPKLIYVSLTGYGQTGPNAMKAGHDLNYIAESGFLGITGNAENLTIPGGQVADIAAGSYMALNACLAAVIARYNTGLGQHVDVAMLDGMIPLTVFAMADYTALGQEAKPGNHQLSGKLPNYNIYKTQDGRHMALGALEPKFWNAFCDGVQIPNWKEGILANDAELVSLKQAIAKLFSEHDSHYWLNFATQHDCCLSLVKTMDEVAFDAHLNARGSISNVAGNLGIGQPIQFSGTPGKLGWTAPTLGADNQQVLKDFGFSSSEIEAAFNNELLG